MAAQRSAHRRSRGLNEVRRRRLWATLNLLIKHGFCPMSSESLMRWCTYDKRKGLFREYPIDDKDFNAWILLDFNGDGIRANAKIHILKQFTTMISGDFSKGRLYVLMQRYTF